MRQTEHSVGVLEAHPTQPHPRHDDSRCLWRDCGPAGRNRRDASGGPRPAHNVVLRLTRVSPQTRTGVGSASSCGRMRQLSVVVCSAIAGVCVPVGGWLVFRFRFAVVAPGASTKEDILASLPLRRHLGQVVFVLPAIILVFAVRNLKVRLGELPLQCGRG